MGKGSDKPDHHYVPPNHTKFTRNWRVYSRPNGGLSAFDEHGNHKIVRFTSTRDFDVVKQWSLPDGGEHWTLGPTSSWGGKLVAVHKVDHNEKDTPSPELSKRAVEEFKNSPKTPPVPTKESPKAAFVQEQSKPPEVKPKKTVARGLDDTRMKALVKDAVKKAIEDHGYHGKEHELANPEGVALVEKLARDTAEKRGYIDKNHSHDDFKAQLQKHAAPNRLATVGQQHTALARKNAAAHFGIREDQLPGSKKVESLQALVKKDESEISHNIQTGPKGGQFYETPGGKVYVKK